MFYCRWQQFSSASLRVCSSGEGGREGKDLPVCTSMCGFAHDCGCMVNGIGAMSSIIIYNYRFIMYNTINLNEACIYT